MKILYYSEVIPQSSVVILQVEMSSENESAGALNNSEVMKRTAKFSIDYDHVGLKCASCDGIFIGPQAFKEHMEEINFSFILYP